MIPEISLLDTKTEVSHWFFSTATGIRLAVTLAGIVLFTAAFVGFSRPQLRQEAMVPSQSVVRVTTSSETLIERDTRLLAITAAERLDAMLEPLFTDFHSRVPAFGEWAFGWRTGYRFLREGMLTAITTPFSHNAQLEQVNLGWNKLIADKFNELVLTPAGGIAALQSINERWLTEMRPTVDMVMMDTLHTVALLHGQPVPLPLDEEAAVVSTLTEQDSFLTEVTTAASPIKTRAARPLIARLTIRPPVAAAVTAAGEAIGHQTETLLGSVSNLATVIVAFLSIDYMLSQTDAGINRPSLEAEVHQVLENEQQRLRNMWLSEQQATIDARLALMYPLLNIGNVNSPPSSAPARERSETDHLPRGQ